MCYKTVSYGRMQPPSPSADPRLLVYRQERAGREFPHTAFGRIFQISIAKNLAPSKTVAFGYARFKPRTRLVRRAARNNGNHKEQ